MRKSITNLVLIIVAIVAAGCFGRGTPTSAPETKEAQAVATATPIPSTAAATNTPLPPTNTPEPTLTPIPEPTPTPKLPVSPGQESQDASKAAMYSDITGVIWQWTELHEPDGQSVIADPENYVLVFSSAGTFTIKADCNAGHGTYTLNGNRITFGPMALTQAMCPPGSRSDQFIQLLGKVDTVAVQDGRLIFDLKDQAGKMVFDCAGTAKIGWPSDNQNPWIKASIVGMIWQWTEIHEPAGQSAVADPENYTLVFHPDGTFTINADCNSGSGTYTLDEDRLTLDVTAITEAYCGDESLFDLFITMLDNVSTVQVDAPKGTLVLTLADGAGKMIFDAAGKAKVPPDPCDWTLDVLWKWERFDDSSDENDIVVADPSKYTLQLLPDGTFRFKADCNVGSGTYTCCCGSNLTFELGPTTLAECGPDSLYDKYLANLEQVVSYVFSDGKLVLNLTADAGNMIFGQDGKVSTGPRIDPKSVTLDAMDMPYSWQANLIPATPYDASQPTRPKGLPEHIQVNFGVTNPADKQPGDPAIYIIPIEPYKKLWETGTDASVSVAIEALQAILQSQPSPFSTAGIPVLPFEEIGGTNDLAAQGRYTNLGVVGGLRFVGRFAQSPTPVTNEGLRYIAQGFAGDADEYLVAFFYPVTTTALPDSATDVPAAELDRLQADPEAYLEERAATLNGLSNTDFVPSLATLDAVISSLRFSTTP